MSAPGVRSGLDVLRDRDFAPLRGMRIGVVTHPAAVDGNLRHICELLTGHPHVSVAAIFIRSIVLSSRPAQSRPGHDMDCGS